jgi:hypothetical protein
VLIQPGGQLAIFLFPGSRTWLLALEGFQSGKNEDCGFLFYDTVLSYSNHLVIDVSEEPAAAILWLENP